MATNCRIGEIIYMFYQFLFFINYIYIIKQNTLTFFYWKTFNGYIFLYKRIRFVGKELLELFMFAKVHTKKTFTKYLHDKNIRSFHWSYTKKNSFYFLKASVFPFFSCVKIKYKVILQPIIWLIIILFFFL